MRRAASFGTLTASVDRLLLRPRHPALCREAFYYTSDAQTPFPRLQAVDSLLFRLSGTAAPGTANNGFYFDDVVVSNSPPV